MAAAVASWKDANRQPVDKQAVLHGDLPANMDDI